MPNGKGESVMEPTVEGKVGDGVRFKLMFKPNDIVTGTLLEILPDKQGRKPKKYRIQPDKPIGADQYTGTVFRYQPFSFKGGLEVEDVIEFFERDKCEVTK
jgi:hypothetical protein